MSKDFLENVVEKRGKAVWGIVVLALVGLQVFVGAGEAGGEMQSLPGDVDGHERSGVAAQRVLGRERISLSGSWFFQTNGAPEEAWKQIKVPSSFEDHEGTNFDGVGWYRRKVAAPKLNEGERLLLEFEAAATEAELFWNGQKAGAHLGGWTPFRADVTGLARGGEENEIRLRLDEKVGHNTQGFLPIIQPHFGGLWQEASLLRVAETYVDDLKLAAWGNVKSGMLEFEVPVIGSHAEGVEELWIRHRLMQKLERGAPSQWIEEKIMVGSPECAREGAVYRGRIAVPNFQLWSVGDPNLYEIEVEIPSGDKVATRAGFRSIEAHGTQLRLNGIPLNVRGLLNWGYYPPRLAPFESETEFRKELEFARSCGFNLMKFCLWIPPKRYLELADEMGMLTWMEYPTWHPQLKKQFFEPLLSEFTEFFYYDRGHPSVILRSLTCETGPSAELAVIQALYDRAHQLIPGALVEDDSSWIGWNRIHDFYDDHPYGNNHTWVRTLQGFNEHILAHGAKPLLLGESMAADTWARIPELKEQLKAERPFWAPQTLDDQERWVEKMRRLNGAGGIGRLIPESLEYAMLMRKYQAETFRREVPYGGYVISVMRDINSASMGLLDYQGKPKWPAEAWRWQRDTVLLLKSTNDVRAFTAGTRLAAGIFIHHFGKEALKNALFKVELKRGETTLASLDRKDVWQKMGTLAEVARLDFALASSSAPEKLALHCSLTWDGGAASNQWPIWVVPAPKQARVWLHDSVSGRVGEELFPGAKLLGGERPEGVVVAAKLDDRLVEILESGGRVLFMPNGERLSLPLRGHWFLQGAPYIPESGLSVPREMLVQLQHFDLAGPVVPDITYVEEIQPILMLWDTHGQTAVKTHGLIYESRVGKGRLLVSAARHGGEANAAGRWLLGRLVEHLESGPVPSKALSPKVWNRVKQKLHEDKILLVERPWKFRPDPKGVGVEQGWQKRELEESEWKEIRVGLAWESQGWPALDYWAWYRIETEIPRAWAGRPVFLSFEGVDDMYELYVNGKIVAKRGDMKTKESSFSERLSHNITEFVKPGDKATIAVRVYDWFGAGGIFRPVTLGTTELVTEGEMLK